MSSVLNTPQVHSETTSCLTLAGQLSTARPQQGSQITLFLVSFLSVHMSDFDWTTPCVCCDESFGFWVIIELLFGSADYLSATQ